MITIIKMTTLILGTIITFSMIMDYFKRDNSNIIIYPAIAFYFFYYIPIFLDLIIGRPIYSIYYPGFIKSNNDFITELIFCLIVIYVISCFKIFQKKNNYSLKFNVANKMSNIIFILSYMIILTFVIYVMFNKEVVNTMLQYNMKYYIGNNSSLLKSSGFIIILIILFLMMLENRLSEFWIKFTLLSPFILFSFLINGKRAVVMLFVIGISFIIIIKRMFKKRSSYIIFLVVMISSMTIFQYYFTNFRINDVETNDERYAALRINYGRDDTLKMVIHSELNKNDEYEILDYRGKTLLYYLTFYIRRDKWTNKPYPYAVYFTNELANLNRELNPGWAMTTSIFDELLSNLGWIGILILPFLFNIILKKIIKMQDGILGKIIIYLAIVLSILIIAVQISAFMYFYLLLIILISIYKIKKFALKSKMRKNNNYTNNIFKGGR